MLPEQLSPYNHRMERTVCEYDLHDPKADQDVRRWWQLRPPGERLAGIERLRRHAHGNLPRLSRVVQVLECPQR